MTAGLLAALALVLLVACLDLASISAARTAARRQELAIRAAPGAGVPWHCGHRRVDRVQVEPLRLEPSARDLKLSYLMALALLEAGAPMSIEPIAARLRRLSLPPRLAAARDPAALLKAWHVWSARPVKAA